MSTRQREPGEGRRSRRSAGPREPRTGQEDSRRVARRQARLGRDDRPARDVPASDGRRGEQVVVELLNKGVGAAVDLGRDPRRRGRIADAQAGHRVAALAHHDQRHALSPSRPAPTTRRAAGCCCRPPRSCRCSAANLPARKENLGRHQDRRPGAVDAERNGSRSRSTRSSPTCRRTRRPPRSKVLGYLKDEPRPTADHRRGPPAGLPQGDRRARLQVQRGGAGGLRAPLAGLARPLPGRERLLAEGIGRQGHQHRAADEGGAGLMSRRGAQQASLEIDSLQAEGLEHLAQGNALVFVVTQAIPGRRPRDNRLPGLSAWNKWRLCTQSVALG